MTSSTAIGKQAELSVERPVKKLNKTDVKAYFSLENNPLIDIISAKYHSDDFNQTRANYISGRLWLMCIFFAITVPLFSFFDVALLPEEQAVNLLYARVGLSLSLFTIAFVLRSQPNVKLLRSLTLVTFLLPTLFYLYTMQNFAVIEVANVPIVYTMMPYLIVAMLGLFPLTLLGGFSLINVVFLPFVGYEIGQMTDSVWPLLNAIWLFSLFAGISLWLQTSQLSMLMKLYRESTVDPLTKLINRRVLMRMAEKEQKRSQELRTPFSIIMFDLDKFKRINDNYGHHVGDQVLVMTAKVMKQVLQKPNVAARFGGEEFVGILSGANHSEAIAVAEDILMTLKAQTLTLANGESLRVTASIGVTQYQPNEELEEAFQRVDELLYAAKGNGRDRVVSELPTD